MAQPGRAPGSGPGGPEFKSLRPDHFPSALRQQQGHSQKPAFRKMAVERLKGGDNIVALSAELGVHRRLLYKWRDQLEPIDDGQRPPGNSKERELRLQVAQLKRLVPDKTLEADFS